MTLLELLVKELPCWPEDAETVGVNPEGRVFAYWTCHTFKGRDLLIRTGLKGFVDQHQYEAALAASQKVEWDGMGLPPVGCKCSIEDSDGNWPIVWFHGVKKSDGDYIFEDSLGALISASPSVVIRPIRSEADKKRDSAIDAMKKLNIGDFDDPAIIYDAISAGKIPGVRIE